MTGRDSYIPGIRSDQESFLKTKDSLGTETLGLVQVCKFTPRLGISGDSI